LAAIAIAMNAAKSPAASFSVGLGDVGFGKVRGPGFPELAPGSATSGSRPPTQADSTTGSAATSHEARARLLGRPLGLPLGRPLGLPLGLPPARKSDLSPPPVSAAAFIIPARARHTIPVPLGVSIMVAAPLGVSVEVLAIV
jgi:hypothetical protein